MASVLTRFHDIVLFKLYYISIYFDTYITVYQLKNQGAQLQEKKRKLAGIMRISFWIKDGIRLVS